MVVNRRRFIQGMAAASLAGPVWSAPARKVMVLGHRGASAVLPEHTLEGFARAIADGADFIEPDLVCTRDGVFVARHEADLTGTTDVAQRPEFARLRTNKTIDGIATNGWFADDFTFAELKTLRAIERMPEVRKANIQFNGKFEIPSWEEIVALASRAGRKVGLIPELKHAAYYAARGMPLEQRFSELVPRELDVIVQSFETDCLKKLDRLLDKRRNAQIAQLVDDVGASLEPAGLAAIARYADIVSPSKRAIIEIGSDGKLGAPTSLVTDAHKAGLQVHVWTFRPENRYLPTEYQDGKGPLARNEAGAVKEVQRYLAAGIDGFFIDDSAVGRRAVDSMRW